MADEFQRFLMAFSERPGRSLEISHQRLPKLACAWKSVWVSWASQSPFLMEGSRWLYQRSRHCLPRRPIMRFLDGSGSGSSGSGFWSLAAICAHLMTPSADSRCMACTASTTILSSSTVHLALLRPGRMTLVQRWRHWMSVRTVPSFSATRFHFLGPSTSTICSSRASSSLVHLPPMLGLRGRARFSSPPDVVAVASMPKGVVACGFGWPGAGGGMWA
mmetsp:Transcript_24129/g.72408  ORF Transcript_24129/g.72408 Transcript_24129/m.72408 type:complete len:218 (+) Transcript_24129:82-735(+)